MSNDRLDNLEARLEVLAQAIRVSQREMANATRSLTLAIMHVMNEDGDKAIQEMANVRADLNGSVDTIDRTVKALFGGNHED